MAPKIITEQEIAQREQTIISAACKIAEKKGFSNLTMDSVVSSVPFSKGSVYKHFNSIEEVIIAITSEGAIELLNLMDQAFEFKGNSREKYLALTYAYLTYAREFPIHYQAEITALSPKVLEKTSPERMAQGLQLMKRFQEKAARVVELGLETRELPTNHKKFVDKIEFNAWTTVFGLVSYSHSLTLLDDSPDTISDHIFWNINTFLNGLGWTPTSSEKNYKASWKRIQKHFNI